MAFRTTLVAVPALRRVDPAITSGPVSRATTTSANDAPLVGPWATLRPAQVTKIVAARRKRAYSRAARTNGVTPDAATPHTTSAGPTAARRSRCSASRILSSAPSTDLVSAAGPPAMTATTREGGTP